MKKVYKKPIVEVIELFDNVILMSNSDKEPEITGNIGAKEMDFVIFSEDNISCNDIWKDKTE